MRGTHEVHENWATMESNDSTVRCIIKIKDGEKNGTHIFNLFGMDNFSFLTCL